MTDRAALLRRYRELVLDELPRDVATGPALTQAVRAAAHLVVQSQPVRQLWWLQTVCDGAEPARQPTGSNHVG